MNSRSNQHVWYIWLVYILASSHIHIFRFLCICLYLRILTSSNLQVHMSLLASLRPHIHRFCVLACIFASSHPHILRFISVSLYPRILAFSCPQAYECLLLSLHFTSSYHQVHVSLLVSSQAFVLDFYHTSKKIYRKQPLRADLNKVVAKISTESLKNTCKRNIFFRKVTS